MATIDDDMMPVVNAYKWFSRKAKGEYTYYGYTKIHGLSVGLHRLVMNAPKGTMVDHIDGDGLNNTRANLRFVTHSQNGSNRPKRAGTSRYKGVYRQKGYSKWHAQITVHRKVFFLGGFALEKEAALAYDVAARKHFGEFARLNFTDGDSFVLRRVLKNTALTSTKAQNQINLFFKASK